MNRYQLLGLELRCNEALGHLAPAPTLSPVPPVDIRLGRLPAQVCPDEPGWRRLVGADQDQALPVATIVRVDRRTDGALLHRYTDGTTFFVDARGREIYGSWTEGTTLEDVAVYLLGPILGAVLHQRRIIALHASAIDVDGRAVALVGSAGAGKSTTAAAFAKRGLPILTDDITTLGPIDADGAMIVEIDKPILRLWPDACARVFGHADALPLLAPPWEKRFLDLSRPGFRSAETPRPLRSVYVLDRSAATRSTILIEDVQGHEALMTLVRHTYALPLLDERMRADELDYLATKLPGLTVRRVAIPPMTGPEQVCAAIIDDLGERRDASQRRS